MSSIWFTSDTHYGHANIIKYAKRPFSSVAEMDEAMIKRWNDTVKPGDTVYHLGDFCFATETRAIEIAKSLKGNKHLIFGNHDKRLRYNKEFLALWSSYQDFKEIRIEDTSITLCHYAMKVWNKSHHGAWSLFGHSHGTLPDDPGSRSTDVGVDLWNYTPVSFEQLKQVMAKKKFVPVDRHGE